MTNVVRNMDDKQLEPIGNARLIIGSVYEVNGDGAQEIPEFVPTRNELLELVKYWTQVATKVAWFDWIYGQTGSTEIREQHFARLRVDRIAKLIGEDEVNEAVDTAIAAMGEEPGSDIFWTIFQEGRPLEDVVDHYAQAINLDPTADNFLSRGQTYQFLEQYELALADYNQAINLDAENIGALQSRADMLGRLGRISEAIEDYSTLIGLRPEEAQKILIEVTRLLRRTTTIVDDTTMG